MFRPFLALLLACASRASFFWKELLRDCGLAIGRLDSRYTAFNRTDAGISGQVTTPTKAHWPYRS